MRYGWSSTPRTNTRSVSGVHPILPAMDSIGCTPETLRRWVRQGERDSGAREGATTSEQQRVKELEREVRELRRANEILKLAGAYFAQAELDRRLKS